MELEDEPDRLIAKLRQRRGVELRVIDPRHAHRAAVHMIERADDIQQRALPAPRWPDDRDGLTVIHAQIEFAQYLHRIPAIGRAVAFPEVFDFEQHARCGEGRRQLGGGLLGKSEIHLGKQW